ncbi:MAG: hypothetical protein Q7S74_03420 [Nanoarchaeota archaeon]|nr:hypothetical protein [Nanoarchaeota archaeon]
MTVETLVGNIGETASNIKRLGVCVNDRLVVARCDTEEGVRPLRDYVEYLKSNGVDIGKGETPEFGYRMPQNPNVLPKRNLIVFRRHY